MRRLDARNGQVESSRRLAAVEGRPNDAHLELLQPLLGSHAVPRPLLRPAFRKILDVDPAVRSDVGVRVQASEGRALMRA